MRTACLWAGCSHVEIDCVEVRTEDTLPAEVEWMTTLAAGPTDEMTLTLASIQTESGKTLLSLAEASPMLLIFLRHFGCAFCRKAISDIADLGPELTKRGVRPVFVHLGPTAVAKAHFDYYGLSDVERVSDPGAAVYRLPLFGLGRKNPLGQALLPAVWLGWIKGTIFRHGIGKIEGDGHQMPGLFYIKDGQIASQFVYQTIADEPNYLKLLA